MPTTNSFQIESFLTRVRKQKKTIENAERYTSLYMAQLKYCLNYKIYFLTDTFRYFLSLIGCYFNYVLAVDSS